MGGVGLGLEREGSNFPEKKRQEFPSKKAMFKATDKKSECREPKLLRRVLIPFLERDCKKAQNDSH